MSFWRRAFALIGVVSALAACAGGMSASEMRAEEQPRIDAARKKGAAWRDAIPACAEAAIPEGARRIEGRLARVSHACTELYCFARKCCNECSSIFQVKSDQGEAADLIVPDAGPVHDNFLGAQAIDCESYAWWEGVAAPRLRITWRPASDAEKKAELIELCKVGDAK